MDEIRGEIEDGMVKVMQDQKYLLKDTKLEEKQGIKEASLTHPENALSNKDQELAEPQNDVFAGVDAENLGYDSNTLLQRLRVELEAEQGFSKRERDRTSHFERLFQDSEMERKELEDQLACVRADLSRAEAHSHEFLQVKAEKEELYVETVRLTSLVQELQIRLNDEEETRKHLREKYEADIFNYELQLQTVEKEKEKYLVQMAKDHEAVLLRLTEEHREQALHFQQQLETWQDHGDNFSQSYHKSPGENLNMTKAHRKNMDQEEVREYGEDLDLDLNSPSSQNHLIEKYLASADLQDSSWVEESVEVQSLLVQAENYRFQLDGEIDRSVCLSCDSYNLDESSEEIDLGKALLIQQCRDLTTQLEEREEQLRDLQDKICCSAVEVREALEKWSTATESLEFVRQELEAERELRQHCEKVISCKTKESENLKDKLGFLQEKEGRSRDESNNLIIELKEEKKLLLVKLKEQEQLVRDVQEQKSAGDSVSKDVQALFGRQLSVLQEQRDRLQDMLDSQQAKNLTTTELLGQKTMDLDCSLKELQRLQTELSEREEILLRIGKEKTDLESRLSGCQKNLVNAEQVLSEGAKEKAALKDCLIELEIRATNAENTLESVQVEFQNQVKAKDLDVKRLVAEKERLEADHQEKESSLETELARIRDSLRDQDRAHAVAIETLVQREAEKLHTMEEEAAQLTTVHQEEMQRLQEKHRGEVNDLTEDMQLKLSELKAALEEEQRKQIALIKQVHEREHQREMAALTVGQTEALSQLTAELKESMEAAHQAELIQAQTQQALELEALRLSLTNQHSAELELSQSTLQRDKEVALSELQDRLRAEWSQDSATLQAKHQAELESIREQNREQTQRVEHQHQQEKDELKRMLKEKTQMEEQHSCHIEALRAEWQQETERIQAKLQSALTETQQTLSAVRAQLEELQARRNQEIHRLEGELSRARSERDAATRVAEDLVTSHKGVLQAQEAHVRHLEELCSASTEREHQLQQQVERLQADHMTLKSSSEQEVSHLWTQLECMRVSRQELEDLREQLLTRSSQAEEVEQLKEDFSRQRRDIQEHNEAELDSLRTYFEQRLRAAEESYREEVALLQCRLVEGAEESQAGDSSFLWEKIDEERNDLLADINAKLENHKKELDSLRLQLEEKHKQELDHLRTSLTLTYREELLQVKTDLTDHYFSQIQDLKTRHSLELEQQRARLSDNHIKEITKLRLQSAQDAARQVEQEVEERGRALAQEHQDRMAQVRSEKGRIQDLEAQMAALVKGHKEQLKQVEEQYRELIQNAEEKLKQDFVEKLRMTTLKVQAQERERVGREFSQDKEEELGKIREKILIQAEGQLSALREEMERVAAEEREMLGQQVRGLQSQLEEERGRLRTLQDSLENEQDPRIQAVRQKVQAQYECELHLAKHTMALEVKELNTVLLEQAETKLREAQSRFQEEKKELEEKLSQKHEAALCELTKKNQGTLASQKALLVENVHKLELLMEDHQNLEVRLKERHRVELDSLRVELQERSRAKVEAMKAETEARHRAESDELEARMLSNMDTLESTYLAEIQSIRDERDHELQELRDSFDKAQHKNERAHSAELKRLRAEHQTHLVFITEELRRELALARLDKSFSSSSEQDKAQQLITEVPDRKQELEEKPADMDTEEAPTHDWGNLLSKLRADLRTMAEERRDLLEAHRQLQKVLQVVVRRTVATEDEIQRRAGIYTEPNVNHRDKPRSKRAQSLSRDTQEKGEEENKSKDMVPDCSLPSFLMDEGLELSPRLSESTFSRPGLEPEVKEEILGPSARLASAVDRLLELLPQSCSPAHLEEQLRQSSLHSDQANLQQHQSPERQDLHKAEGLMECCAVEKAALEEVLQQKETQVQGLVQELEGLQAEMERLCEERALLLRQRETLAGPLGDTGKALLEEAQQLMREKVDTQQQAERDRSRLASHLKIMEAEMEEQEACRLELERQQRAQVEDLQLQIQALERQLKHHRQFIDEQAVEREQEREEFQLEIQKLEAQLRAPQRPHSGGGCRGDKVEDLFLQVENLQAALKEKLADYNTLLQTKEEYRGNIAEQNEQIHKMAGRISELEKAQNLLEQELQTARMAQQDLVQNNEDFQQQLCPNCLLVSALQCKRDEPCHWTPEGGAPHILREQLEAAEQGLVNREEQAELQTGRLEQVQVVQVEEAPNDQNAKLEEPLQLKPPNQNSQFQNDNISLKENMWLVSLLPETDREKDSTSVLLVSLTQQLEQKNQEILRLQQEADISKNMAVEEEQAEVEVLRSRVEELNSQVEELHFQVEHLLSDRDRLRQDGEVEVERLHEVIHKLQEELEQMGPTRHEVSTSPESSPSPLPHHLRTPLHGHETSLCHELTPHVPKIPHALLQGPQTQSDLDPAWKDTQGETSCSHGQAPDLDEERWALGARLSLQEGEVELLTGLLSLPEDQGRPSLTPLLEERQAEAHSPGPQASEMELEGQAPAGMLRTPLKALQAQVHQDQVQIHKLEAQREDLRQQKGQLQEEVERLKEKVTSYSAHIQHLNSQLEEKVKKQAEAQKEMLTFAKEVLDRAGGALRQNKEQLTQTDFDYNTLKEQHDALKAELVAVQERLSSSTCRARKLVDEGQDLAHTDQEIYSQSLKGQQRELERLQEHCSSQEAIERGTPARKESFLSGLRHEASSHSPELLRMLEGSEDPPLMLHSSQLSDLSSLPMKASPLAHDISQLPEILITPSPGSVTASEDISALESLNTEEVEALDELYLTGFEEWDTDGDGSSVISQQDATLTVELGSAECLNASFVEYLHSRDMDVTDSADSATESVGQSDELLSPELEGLLKRVFQEGHRVLSLSVRPGPVTMATHSGQPEAPPLTWQAERRALQQTVLSLRELLCKMADREPKLGSGEADLHRELQQAVRSVFHSEWAELRSELQSVMTTPGPQHLAPFMEQLQKLLKQQEEQQRSSLEQLLSADRLGLREEVQNLHSLLSASTLRSHEQLQQLQVSLSASQESKLCRHAELLESPLSVRQPRGSKTELSSVQLHTASELQLDLHSETCSLRTKLESVEAECQEAILREQSCSQRLQGELDQERLRSKRSHEEQEQALQVLHLSLEEHAAQISQLREALEQERMVSSSLKDQLQSEHSCFQALITQERSQASEALQQLVDERESRTRLTTSLTQERSVHTRKLQEEARRHEETASQDRKFIEELRGQLEQERRQAEELAIAMDRLHQQAIQTKRQLEEETQRRHKAERREQEAVAQLTAAKDGLQTLRQEAGLSLEAEQHRASQLQAQLHTLREELRSEKERQRRKAERQQQAERENRYSSSNQRPVKSPESEKLAWQHEHAALQAALHSEQAEFSQVTAGVKNQPITSSSNSKMLRLYRKYLRAESFRKALVYQKKYLLLLLGRFMDCEQMALTLIASMGTPRSPVALQAPPPQSSPITRFRSAVHAVIAISRLSFLVRKWQRAFRTLTPNSILTRDARPHPKGQGHSPCSSHQAPLQTAQQVLYTSCSPEGLHGFLPSPQVMADWSSARLNSRTSDHENTSS
ncbi:hypothetical protein AGOR_G00059940 [Albula goreensis]|uniref:Pericentrin/AKAP-450 centrosomal targeting domain-containing protein n=1 Tax=Albula goreensis TaxID=1534307 RepID=A0A8T3DV35_9TELE|nr:hypothetical protein AGOR_G00059940 [Albula goreensis]